jgi:UDP-N-acetylglucosamine 2-epimerase (non-hydrolysing)
LKPEPHILHVVGARPNFMKIAPVISALRAYPCRQSLVHTGQHYDPELSDVFFRELELPDPDAHLGVGSGSHGEQVGRMLLGLGDVLSSSAPDLVVVAGDVNSTLAGALAAAQQGVPVVHVESGLRSFDPTMPEEINRRVVDHLAVLLLTHCSDADGNLTAEGIDPRRIAMVGNTMIDSLQRLLPRSLEPARSGEYVLVTLHRPATVDDPERLPRVLEALDELANEVPVVFPVHPRTRSRIEAAGWHPVRLELLGPLPYLAFIGLEASARAVLTDSGGVQEETTALGVPCFTFREVTERPITCTVGTNRVIGVNPDVIPKILRFPKPAGRMPDLWDGSAGERAAARIWGVLT